MFSNQDGLLSQTLIVTRKQFLGNTHSFIHSYLKATLKCHLLQQALQIPFPSSTLQAASSLSHPVTALDTLAIPLLAWQELPFFLFFSSHCYLWISPVSLSDLQSLGVSPLVIFIHPTGLVPSGDSVRLEVDM